MLQVPPEFAVAVRNAYQSVTALAPHEDPSPRDVRVAARSMMRHLSGALAELDRESPDKIHCKAGCAFCCYVMASAHPIELLALGMHIQRYWGDSERADLMDRLEQRLEQQEGLNFEECKDLELPCALLDIKQGMCMEYDWRPTACRAWHSYDVVKCKEDAISPDEDVNVPTNAFIMGMRSAVASAEEMAVGDTGLVWGVYELSSALHRILSQDAKLMTQRWLSGEDVFAGCLQDEGSKLLVDGGVVAKPDAMREMERMAVRSIVGQPPQRP